MRPEVPFGQPYVLQDEIDEVVATLRSGWLTSGPRAKLFEEEFRAYTGAKHALAVNSCTAALQLTLLAAGIGAGAEVITTPLTFVATANAIEHTGATPIFADVDPVTHTLSAERVAEKVGPRTKAVLPVHLRGVPADLAAISAAIDPARIAIVSDAAHAIESWYHGAHVATHGLAAAFSFQATKTVTTGDGGMITTADDQLARRVRMLRAHGLDKDTWQRHGDTRGSEYELVVPGFKYGLSDLAAAVGIHQLRRVERNLQVRQAIAARYHEAFGEVAELELVTPPPPADGNRDARYLYPILLRDERLRIDRDQFAAALRERGIGCGVHYRAVHLQAFYRTSYGYQPGDFPVAEDIAARNISLPLSPAMTDADVDKVITAVLAITASARNHGRQLARQQAEPAVP
jgi:dTDP-4-amino-4,6-dideoxygalactose transaminase